MRNISDDLSNTTGLADEHFDQAALAEMHDACHGNDPEPTAAEEQAHYEAWLKSQATAMGFIFRISGDAA